MISHNRMRCKLSSFNCKNLRTSIECVRKLCGFSDVVALQETWLLPHCIPLLGTISQDFEYTGKSSVDTSTGLLVGRPYGGVAILWRKGMFESVTVLDCNSDRVIAIKVTSDNRSVIIFSVYMPTDKTANLPIFTEVLSEISALGESSDVETLIMLGDFNAHPGEPFYKELSDFSLEQSWRCADVEKLGYTSDTYTFVCQKSGSRRWLDHCVVSLAAWHTVVKVGVCEDVYTSDHLPIYIECNLYAVRQRLRVNELPPSAVLWGERSDDQINRYHEICNNIFRDIHFPPEFVECAHESCTSPEHRTVLDRLYNDIVNTMTDGAVQTKQYGCGRHRKSKNLCGWNVHVQAAHAEARLKFKTWVFFNRPSSGSIYEDMCVARKIFKSRLKWCQNHQDQLIMDKIAKERAAKDFKTFWKSTNRLNTGPGLPVSVEGKSDHGEIAQLFMEHFRVRSPLGPSVGVSDAESIGRGDEPILQISAKQVAATIKGMTRGKSPGHDGLSIEHLKYAGNHLPRILSMFYTLCLSHAYLPADFMKTKVVPIVKNRTGDIADKGNYRPISLATTIAKVLDSVLESILQKYLQLHDAQFGFRPGLSTESAILGLKHTVQYYTSRRTPVYACFLDLSKAFDLVSYDVLWRKLGDRGVPKDVLTILQYWYRNQSNVVKWSNAVSESFRLECGVRQGGVSSPSLFSLYVNDLIVELSSMRIGCRVDGVSVNNISYADDMVLLGPTAGSVRDMLKVCATYAASHGLSYNVKKCEYIVFKADGNKMTTSLDLTLNGMNIKKVSTFKYLGHHIADDLKDNVDIERERRALAVRGNMLIRRFTRCTEEVKITLFKAYCQSLYTANLWVDYTKKSLETLRIQYNNIFRMMLGLPRFCSASGMFAEYQTDGFAAILRKKTASLIRRVRDSQNSILRTISDRLNSPVWKCFIQRVIKPT